MEIHHNLLSYTFILIFDSLVLISLCHWYLFVVIPLVTNDMSRVSSSDRNYLRYIMLGMPQGLSEKVNQLASS